MFAYFSILASLSSMKMEVLRDLTQRIQRFTKWTTLCFTAVILVPSYTLECHWKCDTYSRCQTHPKLQTYLWKWHLFSLSFPACHFGKLYGLMMSMSAVVSLLQYPCFALVKGALGGDPFFVSAQESLRRSFTEERAVDVKTSCTKLIFRGHRQEYILGSSLCHFSGQRIHFKMKCRSAYKIKQTRVVWYCNWHQVMNDVFMCSRWTLLWPSSLWWCLSIPSASSSTVGN